MKILLMEDEIAIRMAMKRRLQHAGHEVHAAGNLCEARALASQYELDMLLSDLKLPDGSGLEMAEELMIPFIIMSGYAVFDDAVAALRLGCVDFFTKPVPIQDIVRRIEGIEASQGSERLGCIELTTAGVQTMQVNGQGFERGSVEVHTWEWTNPAEARSLYDSYKKALGSAAQVHDMYVCAEILQSSAQGRIVLNTYPGRYSLWLDTVVDWECTTEQQDRLRAIQAHTDVCILRTEGLFVERYGGGDT